MRKEITPELVAEAERLLAVGIAPAAIASQLAVTRYVVRVIARDRNRQPVALRPGHRGRRRVLNSQRGIDATTIRMIQRMLAAGMLSHAEIAREAGVSPNTVSDVATGKRAAITLARPILNDGETFLPKPIRCSVCRATISVIPCRACSATREKNLV